MDYGSARASQPAGWTAGPDSLSLPAPAPAAAARASAAAAPAAQLLLFVGTAIQPDTALAGLLGRDGLRCLSLPGTEQALRAAALARFDVVLVDGALVDGRAIEGLAAAHRCPVVVLADSADEVDEIVALELGADLYLARPLSPRRLRAHLRVLRRRAEAAGAAREAAGAAPATAALRAGGWTLEAAQRRLVQGARSVRLTSAHAALLRCLMAAAGDIVPADELMAALPRHDGQHPPRCLRLHVHRLRQHLRNEAVHELHIEAVRGTGYLLAAPAAGTR